MLVDRLRDDEMNGKVRSAAPGSDADPTLQALDALAEALEQIADDRQVLVKKIEELRRSRRKGLAWQEILVEEDGPGSMQVVSRMLACLSKASGTLRKELVEELREEGATIPAIARLFGVTHQRVSNLLRRSPE
ncbi:MAG: hypothetical protein ACRDZR_17560 [Acidimicrobiales bacterium]